MEIGYCDFPMCGECGYELGEGTSSVHLCDKHRRVINESAAMLNQLVVSKESSYVQRSLFDALDAEDEDSGLKFQEEVVPSTVIGFSFPRVFGKPRDTPRFILARSLPKKGHFPYSKENIFYAVASELNLVGEINDSYAIDSVGWLLHPCLLVEYGEIQGAALCSSIMRNMIWPLGLDGGTLFSLKNGGEIDAY